MELRKLTSRDIFPVCRILDKIGIKDFAEILGKTDLSDKKKGRGEAGALGMDIIGILVKHLPDCQDEIYSFLESVVIVPDEERRGLRKKLEEMEMSEFAQLVIDVFQKKEFKDFFSVALKSAGSAK